MRVLEKDPGNERMLARYNQFFERVKEYYLAEKDEKILKSIETGLWVFIEIMPWKCTQ